MIDRIIRWSIEQRILILIGSVLLLIYGSYSLKNMPVDAIPDLSDVQVIIKTPFPGQAPQVVQDQVTYPLTTAMLAVPKAQTVRGFSFFGDSYVYVIFEEGTDMYWARSRVLEYLSQVAAQLPEQVKPELGPDATGVGWIYEYALTDTTHQHDLSELRSWQDWFLKLELQSVPGVAEVASVGGMIRQYQVEVDPNKLRAFHMPLAHIQLAIQRANREAGASVIEMAEAEYMVRASGYLKSIEDIEQIPLGVSENGVPLRLRDIASVTLGPQKRRAIAELNGEGEVVGGIVVMRYGENAQSVIQEVKTKLQALQAGLPQGVEIIPVYDRSRLINAAVDNLYIKIGMELIIVALVCALFLFHFRSSLVVIFSLPLGILAALMVMNWQGVNANIMSLGGIAIAIGAMVDGAIVMVENVHRKIHQQQRENSVGSAPKILNQHWQLVAEACAEVGRPLFFSLLIVTVSFVPVFALQAQEGKLFAPLALTKSYAMAAAAGMAITLVPVLIGYLVRGKISSEEANPLTRGLLAMYSPLLRSTLAIPSLALGLAVIVVVAAALVVPKIGSEFMPPLDEGDLMYMPTTYAGISIGKAREVLQQTDKLIRTLPEVKTVFGKVGRADTATDPAPLTMIETIIQFQPQEKWRKGMTPEKIKEELNQLLALPGLSNAWVMPIKTRIDMLATGIKTPVGIKVAGPELTVIENIGVQLETLLQTIPGTVSVYSERVGGGRYIDISLNRDKAARYGLNIEDLQQIIQSAVGGMDVSETIEGVERYPINVRYPQFYRDSPQQLRNLPIVTARGEHLVLGEVADINITAGPPAIKSENAKINGWTLIDIKDRDLVSYVEEAKSLISKNLILPAGYSLNWAGQYEYFERTKQRLVMIVPLTLLIIVALLYINFHRFTETVIVLASLPFALSGGVLAMFFAGYNFSVAVIVGFIALAGLAVEIGVLMLTYLQQEFTEAKTGSSKLDVAAIKDCVYRGAARRIRPITMTVATVVLGLLPVMFDTGTGSEIMQRIAAPMVGGMITTVLYALIVLPAIYFWWQRSASESALRLN